MELQVEVEAGEVGFDAGRLACPAGWSWSAAAAGTRPTWRASWRAGRCGCGTCSPIPTYPLRSELRQLVSQALVD